MFPVVSLILKLPFQSRKDILEQALIDSNSLFCRRESTYLNLLRESLSNIKVNEGEKQGGLQEGNTTESCCNILPNDLSRKTRVRITIMKYLASVVSLIFLLKTLIWNKLTFPASDSLNFAELVKNELMKSVAIKNYQYSYFYPAYRWLL